MPKDYYAGDLGLYVQGLKEGRAQYSPVETGQVGLVISQGRG